MNIIEEVRSLDLPLGEYVVVGSGILAAKGLRRTEDVDIVVSPTLFKKYRALGWEQMPWTYEKKGQIYLKKGIFELYLDVNCKDFNPTLDELVQRAEVIDGVAFSSLEDTINFKKAYGKPKHLEDVGLIREYLNAKGA